MLAAAIIWINDDRLVNKVSELVGKLWRQACGGQKEAVYCVALAVAGEWAKGNCLLAAVDTDNTVILQLGPQGSPKCGQLFDLSRRK